MARNLKISEINEAFFKYLGCPCTALKVESEEEMTKVYQEAFEQGKAEGFLPVIIVPDENLWESCKFNTAPDDLTSSEFEVAPADIETYRKTNIEMPLEDGQEYLKNELEERVADYLEEKESLPEGERGTVEYVCPQSKLLVGLDGSIDIILAKLPITNPWEVFAYLPFGNWNDCPNTPSLMAVSKYWYEKYKAYPALVHSDIVNYYIEQPVDDEHAMDLAREQFAFCPDIVEQGTETIANLADALVDSQYWFFWWD